MIVIGKKVKAGRPQHLVVGKEYNVTDVIGAALIKNGQAEDPNAPKPKRKTTKKTEE